MNKSANSFKCAIHMGLIAPIAIELLLAKQEQLKFHQITIRVNMAGLQDAFQ